MKVSELIKILKDTCNDSDPEINFMAERWSDDLEEKDYFPAWFEVLEKEDDVINLYIGT